MARLSALRLWGVFKVRVTTPWSSSRLKSSDDAATGDEAVMRLFSFCGESAATAVNPSRADARQ